MTEGALEGGEGFTSCKEVAKKGLLGTVTTHTGSLVICVGQFGF